MIHAISVGRARFVTWTYYRWSQRKFYPFKIEAGRVMYGWGWKLWLRIGPQFFDFEWEHK